MACARMHVAGWGRPVRSLRQLFRQRPLLAVERDFLAAEFGASLDLSRLRMAGGGHPLGRLGWQPAAGWIQLSDSAYEGDDPACPVRTQLWPILAHEALHVWQRVHRQHRLGVSIDGLVLGVVRGRAAYRYDTRSSDPAQVLQTFLRGNIEQQGQMFEDYVRSNVMRRSARDAKFEDMARYVRERHVHHRTT
ncbi:MAG: hypothetical protein RL701_532 [Pseudomonadota bacterium]